MPFFTTLNSAALCREIGEAQEHVVLASPGVAIDVADALIAARDRLGEGRVRVVLDVSAGVARLGFGDHSAVERLTAAGIEVRSHPGLRLGVLICDGRGWSFAGTPRLVEADPMESGDAFNAISLTETQVIALRAELPQIQPTGPRDEPANHGDAGPEQSSVEDPIVQVDVEPLVGAEPLTRESVAKVSRALEIAPPRPFDLARRTMVYSALIQFVELHFEGFNIQSRRIQLPKTLPMIASKDRAVKERLTASLKLLDSVEKPAALASVSKDLEELRQAYLVPVGKAGRVMLKSKRAEFEEALKSINTALNKCKESLVAELQQALDSVVDAIAPDLARAVVADPPPRFRGLFLATSEAAMDYVWEELTKALPRGSELVEGMKIHCLFKDVTYEMLTDDDFGEKVLAQIPKSVIEGALLKQGEAVEAATSKL